MGNYYLMICRTCKMVEWTFDHELADYRKEHQSHDFVSLEPGTSDYNDRVIEWAVQFLGWPAKEEN